MRTVYLDNNATTSVAPEVRDAMLPFFDELWGNPSSMHSFGGQVKKYVEQARAQVAALLGADPSEIVFTSGGSESDNMAIRGAVEAAGGHPHIVTTRVEHQAVLGPCRYLESRRCRLTELPVDSQGRLDLDPLKASLAPDTAIVSIMWANNETGVMFPMDEIVRIVKRNGCVLHTDAVQVVGKLPVDVRRVPVDLLSLSGHKLHAPKGIGALYVRKGTKVNPLILGGHQEEGRRAGTENVPYIVGLGRACELAARHMDEEGVRVAALRDRLEAGLLASCPDVRINGDREHRLPNTVNISFEFIEGEAILLMLDAVGIAASSGSACTSGSLEPSHVLRAMGVPFTAAHGSIRFSLSRYNTDADVDYVLKHMPPIVKRLREISPFVAKSGKVGMKPDMEIGGER
jgi:cysteine desulfurase